MNQLHVRLRIARELVAVRQDDIVSELRQRFGLKLSQADLSHIECGLRVLSPALARQIREVLLAIVESRAKAVKELLSAN
jgi:hypothetical protein